MRAETAMQHGREGINQILHGLAFHEVAVCSGVEHTFGVERFIVLRQDKNACPRTGAQAFRHEIRAAAPAQHQIEQS